MSFYKTEKLRTLEDFMSDYCRIINRFGTDICSIEYELSRYIYEYYYHIKNDCFLVLSQRGIHYA